MRPRRCRLAQGVPEHPPGLGVEARGGLVEEQHLGVVHEGAGDHHPLLLPAGEGEGLAPGLVRELHLREQPVGARLALGRGQAEVAGVEGQHLAHGEVAVEVAALGHHRDAPLGVRPGP